MTYLFWIVSGLLVHTYLLYPFSLPVLRLLIPSRRKQGNPNRFKVSMIIAAHNMLTNGDFYRDPGANYYTAHQPARTKSRAINQLESLGYRVTLEPLTESA